MYSARHVVIQQECSLVRYATWRKQADPIIFWESLQADCRNSKQQPHLTNGQISQDVFEHTSGLASRSFQTRISEL